GNVLWSGGRGWLIDPAAHGGHRETDLAMLDLFGAPFLARILGAYQEVAPLAPGWRARVPLHQLHPLLVHVCPFGTPYRHPPHPPPAPAPPRPATPQNPPPPTHPRPRPLDLYRRMSKLCPECRVLIATRRYMYAEPRKGRPRGRISAWP